MNMYLGTNLLHVKQNQESESHEAEEVLFKILHETERVDEKTVDVHSACDRKKKKETENTLYLHTGR